MTPFTSIESLRHLVQNVRKYCSKQRKPLPVVDFVGTVKTHGCFASDSLVTLQDGSVKAISAIRVGDKVLSYDIETGAHVVAPVTDIYSAVLGKDWIRLHFDNDQYVECTEDHKFYTENRGWVEAKDLNNQDIFVLDH